MKRINLYQNDFQYKYNNLTHFNAKKENQLIHRLSLTQKMTLMINLTTNGKKYVI